MSNDSHFKLDASGPPGHSLFSNFKAWCLREISVDEIQVELDEEIKHVAQYDDERLLVLLGALVVENALDHLLGQFILDYRGLRDNRDFTFSMRIELARAARLIPSKVLGAADTVRQIRNDLVHNLSITSLVQLSPSRTDAMRGRLQEFRVPIEAGEELPQLYSYLVSATTIALRLYAKHVETFNSFIRTDEFSSQLQRYAETQRQ